MRRKKRIEEVGSHRLNLPRRQTFVVLLPPLVPLSLDLTLPPTKSLLTIHHLQVTENTQYSISIQFGLEEWNGKVATESST